MLKAVYIRATGNISPQKSFGHPAFLTEPVTYTGNRLACIEPSYKDFIDARMIRRMSRIIRMGVAAAMECLQEGLITVPDAIITGTAYGCMEDTGLFLSKMVENNEELLTPTAFIQSTHNTIGAQIGLTLNCHNYNNTFVHRGFSYESALLDGMLLLQQNEMHNVLIGAVDEITNISHIILSRMGLYKQDSVSSLDLFKTKSKGTIAGEGAAFFLLSDEPSATDYSMIEGLETFYKPGSLNDIQDRITGFLSAHNVSLKDIDLVITGKNGDTKHDEKLQQLNESIFANNLTVNYKHLCGEYPTSVSFATWMAANIIKKSEIPLVLEAGKTKSIKRILIYNQYLGIHHSLLLLSAC